MGYIRGINRRALMERKRGVTYASKSCAIYNYMYKLIQTIKTLNKYFCH